MYSLENAMYSEYVLRTVSRNAMYSNMRKNSIVSMYCTAHRPVGNAGESFGKPEEFYVRASTPEHVISVTNRNESVILGMYSTVTTDQ
jgi:hypothetical protein